MNPSEKGWFKEYLSERSYRLMDEFLTKKIPSDKEKVIYKWIQPSGLMYGHPVTIPYHDAEKIKSLNDNERLKLLLAESFLMSMYSSVKDRENLKEQLKKAPGKVIQFYQSLFPDVKVSPQTFFDEGEEGYAEDLINERLNQDKGTGSKKNFWSSFFSNSLLFLDVYYFFRYLEEHDSINNRELRIQLDYLRMVIVKVIAAAAHANDSIEKEERAIFNYFIISAKLSPDKKAEARDFFENGADLDKINLPEIKSWLLKKYILELATLTLYSDKILEESELSFLKKLTTFLDFDENEMNASLLSIKAFVMEHWDKIKFLQSNFSQETISKQMIAVLTDVLERNKGHLTEEFARRGQLMELLSKKETKELSDDEKEIVKTQIIEALDSIPAFILISLPGSILTYPILIQVIPKELLSIQ